MLDSWSAWMGCAICRSLCNNPRLFFGAEDVGVPYVGPFFDESEYALFTPEQRRLEIIKDQSQW